MLSNSSCHIASKFVAWFSALKTSDFSAVQTLGNYINGKFVAPANGEYLDNL